MLKISEYEMMELLVLINSNTILESDVSGMLASKSQLSNKVGKIMRYMGLSTIDDVNKRMGMYKDNEEIL